MNPDVEELRRYNEANEPALHDWEPEVGQTARCRRCKAVFDLSAAPLEQLNRSSLQGDRMTSRGVIRNIYRCRWWTGEPRL